MRQGKVLGQPAPAAALAAGVVAGVPRPRHPPPPQQQHDQHLATMGSALINDDGMTFAVSSPLNSPLYQYIQLYSVLYCTLTDQ